MKKIILLLSLITGVLSACNGSSDTTETRGNVQKTEKDEVVETDYSVCNQGRLDSIEGQWRRDSRVGELKLSLTMELRDGVVQMSNTCALYGRSVSVSAATAVRYSSTALEILGSAYDKDSINETDFKLNCEVNLKPLKLNYRLQGQCLVLSAPDDPKEIIMVSVR